MLRKLWSWIASPSARWSLGALLGTGLLAGVLGVVGFEAAMHMSSTEGFCSDACHEMTVNVAAEFQGTSHDVNASGVRATCSDCHVPKEFLPKMMRKIRASLEVYHHLLGTLSTPEKFENHRLRMANTVWREMQQNDSRECRNCHHWPKMNPDLQTAKAAQFHKDALAEGKTCIECHKGIAHKLPREVEEAAAAAAATGGNGTAAGSTE